MARTWHKAKQLTRQTLTGTTTPASVLSLAMPYDASTDYWMLWSLQGDYNSTGRNCNFYLTDTDGAVDLAIPTNRTDNNSNVFSVGGIARWQSPGSAGTRNFDIRHAPTNTADTVGSDEIFLIGIKAETGDQYAENLTADSRTSSALADRASLTFTPGSSGDYLILFSAEVGGVIPASNNGNCRVLLDVNGVQYFDTVDGHQANTAGARYAWAGALVVNLAASSQTIKIRYASADNTNTANIRNTRILAIPLSSFTSATTDQDATEQATSATTPQAAASVSPTVPAADHLVLSAGMIRYTTSARAQTTRTSVAGSARSANTRHQMSSGGTRKASYIGFGYDTLSAGTPTIETQWYAANAGDTARIADAFIGAFSLDAVVPRMDHHYRMMRAA